MRDSFDDGRCRNQGPEDPPTFREDIEGFENLTELVFLMLDVNGIIKSFRRRFSLGYLAHKISFISKRKGTS